MISRPIPAAKRLHMGEGRMRYVDGFVLPVPVDKLPAYQCLTRQCGKVWIEHGALAYTECLSDDVKPGKYTSFPQSVKLKPGETVVFSWVVYASRKQRDRINKAVMNDPRMKEVFDNKRRPLI